MTEGKTIRKIREARKTGALSQSFTGLDIVRIGIPRGTAWTFLWKHCVDRGRGYEGFHKYFRTNHDGSYSLIEDS